jgi:hypothetical protein
MSSQATAGEAAPELRVRSLRWFFGVGERDGLPEAAGWSARPWCRRRTARRAGEGLGCGARLEVVMATDGHAGARADAVHDRAGWVRDVYVGQVCRIRSGRGVIFR